MAKTSTSFRKGDGKPRKRKGTKHKATLIKEAFGVQNWEQLKAFVEGRGLQRLTENMEYLMPKDYAHVFLALCEFVKPKLQRTTVAGDGENPINHNHQHNVVFKKMA